MRIYLYCSDFREKSKKHLAWEEWIVLMSYLIDQLHSCFTPLRTLSRSDRGTVTLLRHNQSGQWFVLRDYHGSAEPYRKLLGLSSPHLPQVYEVAEEGGRVLELEEYIPGDSLASVLTGGHTLSPREARAVGRQLCQALHVLHSRGIVHRDLKPEHVILCGSRAVLVDLDAARLVHPAPTADTQILGTVGYAAPEQFGLAQSDGRTDLYALGVVLNLMVTGVHPTVRLAPGRLGRVIAKCTMTNPDQRYASAAQLYEYL